MARTRGVRGWKFFIIPKPKHRIGNVLLAITAMETFSIFCYMAIPIKLSQSITNSWTAEKVMPYHISPNGSAGGCFLAMSLSWGISPLTCTIFDPNIFLIFSKSIFFHISPTSPKKSIMGNSSTSLLKSHTGATQALTRARERCFVCSDSKFVHLYCYFSVFGLWHKANSVFTSPKFPQIFQKQKFWLATVLFQS